MRHSSIRRASKLLALPLIGTQFMLPNVAWAGLGTQFSQGQVQLQDKGTDTKVPYPQLPTDETTTLQQAVSDIEKTTSAVPQDLSNSAPSPGENARQGSQQKVLTGRISALGDSDLKRLHEEFNARAEKYKQNSFVRKEAFNDFIKRNNFLANLFLIRLSPPDVADARLNFNASQQLLTTGQTQLTTSDTAYQQSEKGVDDTLVKKHFDENNVKWACNELIKARADVDATVANLGSTDLTPQERTALEIRLKAQQNRVNKLVNLEAQYRRDEQLQVREQPIDALKSIVSKQLLMASIQNIAEARGDMKTAAIDLSKSHAPNQDDLPTKNHNAYYLLVFNYNLPAVRPFGLMINYRFARFCAQAMLRKKAPEHADQAGQGQSIPADFDKCYTYTNIPIVSCYPINSTISADLVNTKKLEVQAKPEYSGISAGSITYSDQTQLSYQLKLPRVVGMNTSDGAVQWTYYPAKAQQIAFGAQTGYAVISVPDVGANDLLQLDMMLEYEYKALKIPLGENQEYASVVARFGDAMSDSSQLADFRRLYMRNLNQDDQIQLERMLTQTDPVNMFAPPPSKDAKDSKKKPDATDQTADAAAGGGGGKAGGGKAKAKKAAGKGGAGGKKIAANPPAAKPPAKPPQEKDPSAKEPKHPHHKKPKVEVPEN